ncbi:MAG: DUF3179 domain-containing protein [Gammaproteobacteria bacterium]
MKNLFARGLVLCVVFAASAADAKNGFDLSGATIPADEILRGGPPRDGIPSIDRPKFAAVEDAGFMREEDLVLGVAADGIARAYPIKILNWHEIVNDEIGGAPVAVTFCPLCGSGVVFRAEAADGRRLQFGVSGLLYNSDVLLYDRQTESLWSQLLRRGVSGEYAGAKLRTVPAEHTTWRDWRRRHPQTEILTTDTGAARDYDADPYAGYDKSAATYFPASPAAPREFHPKEWVLGIVSGDAAKAYPFSQLEKNGAAEVLDAVDGREILIHWNAEDRAARVEWTDGGEGGESVRAFWFAWFAFHPQTEIFRAGE